MSQALAETHEPVAIREPATTANLLAIAVERGADVDQLGKLMDLHERHEREQARRAYFAAKTEFQRICPTIIKDREVKYGNTAYKHASLSGIANQIREPLSQCRLSYRWDIQDTPEELRVTCILSHEDGHSESNSMGAAPDDSGAKNVIQQRASTVTYLQRYTLIGVLGLSSANEDDDGKSAGALNVETLREHNEALRIHLDSVYAIKVAIGTGELEKAIEAWAEIPQDDQRALWVAPTKGGIFSTKEREVMKSDEWAATRREMRAAD